MNRLSLIFLSLLISAVAYTQSIGIGTTTPTGILHTSSTGLAVLVDGYNLAGTANTATLAVRSARGTSSLPAAAQTGDRVGSILYSGQNSGIAGNFNNAAGIDVYADEHFSGATGGSSMRFATTPLGSVSRLDRVFITNAGNMGIGTTPAASAQLDVSSNNKGFLPPRMDSTQRNAILSPATGLAIYNTSIKAFQVYNGTAWYSTVHFIGESYGGGIVFYVYDNGQHGLIAATADQNSGAIIRWYGGSITNTRARADGVGAGLKNTAIVIANQGPVDGNAFAATVCNEYSVTIAGVTYGDWYLPSKHELNLLYLQKTIVGGFNSNYYWSSSEYGSNLVWAQGFTDGFQGFGNKDGENRVRAVRAF